MLGSLPSPLTQTPSPLSNPHPHPPHPPPLPPPAALPHTVEILPQVDARLGDHRCQLLPLLDFLSSHHLPAQILLASLQIRYSQGEWEEGENTEEERTRERLKNCFE